MIERNEKVEKQKKKKEKNEEQRLHDAFRLRSIDTRTFCKIEDKIDNAFVTVMSGTQ